MSKPYDLTGIRDMMDRLYTPDYLLRQLAEEYAEVAQAALKLIRATNGETPVCVSDAMAKLIEEIADADIMRDLMFGTVDPHDIPGYSGIRDFKRQRTLDRLGAKLHEKQ